MKLVRATPQRLEFHLAGYEQQLLARVLEFYPCLPPAHQRLCRAGGLPEEEAAQRLLDEALAEQRRENKQQTRALLADRQRFHQTATGWHLRLSPAELEGVFQVLNDVRIGCWVRLGSPEGPVPRVDERNVHLVAAMEQSAHLQMEFLKALEGAGP